MHKLIVWMINDLCSNFVFFFSTGPKMRSKLNQFKWNEKEKKIWTEHRTDWMNAASLNKRARTRTIHCMFFFFVRSIVYAVGKTLFCIPCGPCEWCANWQTRARSYRWICVCLLFVFFLFVSFRFVHSFFLVHVYLRWLIEFVSLKNCSVFQF